MQIGMTELILVFIVALFALGPDRLPGYAKKLGEAVSQFRKYSEEATREIKESVVEPLEEAQAPLREAVKPLEDLDRTVRGDVKDLKDSFSSIGKPKKAAPGKKSEDKSEAENDSQKAAQDTQEAHEDATPKEDPELQTEPKPQEAWQARDTPA